MNLTNIKLDKQKKILIVLFFVLISYVDLAYILKAQKSGLDRLNTKVKRLSSDLATLSVGLETMRVSQSKKDLLTQKTKATNKTMQLLPEEQISGLLQDISNESNKFNVSIIKMNPSREAKNASDIAGDKLKPLYINLDLVCNYHELGKFINALENYPIYMVVAELKILTQMTNYMKQKAVLVLKTYVTK